MNILSKRKHPRLKECDYSNNGAYFITVCTKKRIPLLGHIVGGGDFDAPQMILSQYGTTLDKYINIMNNKYEHINVDKYVIMPNHFHLIINICKNINGASETAAPYNSEIPKFISLLKRYCNRQYRDNIFQTSFHDHIIRSQADYNKIWEYINTNVLKWEYDCFYTQKE